MKTKSEVRRQAILSTAADLFQRGGFEATSMDNIAAAVPCSKVTLYSYFESKEALFYDAIVEPIDLGFQALYQVLEATCAPVDDVLQRFAEHFIRLATSRPVKVMRQLLFTASINGPTALSTRCLQAGPERGLAMCAAYMEAQKDLQIKNPRLAGLQFRALLEAEWLEPLLYGARGTPSMRRVQASAREAVEAFLAIYRR